MIEQYVWPRRLTTAFVLTLGLAAVTTCGYAPSKEVVTYVVDDLGGDWDDTVHIFDDSNDTETGVSSMIGTVAGQCFFEAGGSGLSRVFSDSEGMRTIIFRTVGNETVDPKSIEACVEERYAGHSVTVMPSSTESEVSISASE